MSWIQRTYFTLVLNTGFLPLPYQPDWTMRWNRPLNEAAQVRLGELMRLAGQTARPATFIKLLHPDLGDRMGIVCETTGIDLEHERHVHIRAEPKWRAVPGDWTDARELYMSCQVETELGWDDLDEAARADVEGIFRLIQEEWREQGREIGDTPWSPSRVLYTALSSFLPGDDPARVAALEGDLSKQLQICREAIARTGRSLPIGEVVEARAAAGASPALAPPAPGLRTAPQLAGVRSQLSRFGRDLSELVASGELPPAFGRDMEIDRAIRALLQVEKSNPVFTGPPGVGKSAIAAGVAHRIHEGRVPERMREAVVIELDMSSIMQGTQLRGQLEERLIEILRLARDPRVILFVDEIHRIMEGAGETLKPMLARGEIRLMGATTDAEFHQHIEQDRALARRFARIQVAPPSRQQTVEILTGAKDRYESHHGVTVADEVVEAAVELSDRFVKDRHLPDKAFEAIDRAAVLALTESEDETPSLTVEHIARVVSEMAGVPLGRLTTDERERMRGMGDWLRRKVVGQDPAVGAVTEAVQAARFGLKVSPHRPNGCFIFGGPPGVGKTQLAKALAEFLFDSEDALIRIDMSEMAVGELGKARLLGAAPGYRDSERGGQLTEAVKRRPFSVVLFDEIEKGDTEVLDLLLQVCGDGRLTDGMGETVDFANTVVIMTTNLGAGPGSDRDRMQAAIQARLRPELLDRVDRVVVFSALSPEHARAVLDLKLDAVRQQLRREHGAELAMTETAARHLIERGFGSEVGARELERTVSRLVVAPITNLLSGAGIARGSTVTVDFDSLEGGLTMRVTG